MTGSAQSEQTTLLGCGAGVPDGERDGEAVSDGDGDDDGVSDGDGDVLSSSAQQLGMEYQQPPSLSELSPLTPASPRPSCTQNS